MGKLYKEFLSGSRIYVCAKCECHLANRDDVISKNFQGRSGKAYLVHEVVNIYLGPREDRVLMTGIHTVADIFCNSCHAPLGWKYVEAFEESQKYKEGKFILEKAKFSKVCDA
eukprot:TRINITY_DN618_c0_g1_i1.p2 TRINITY_DN618_c0_g1~~TRINITY_DN618_c0_g1_i1.p2  ORF type:complete len:113 (-),score=23.53 TRINITY_DN618_c0_g1_i1:466-804(-)